MAVLGHTKLTAVNSMLAAIGRQRVSALDTGGPSDAASAEYILDLVISRVQMEGFLGNTVRCKKYTPDGSGKIQVASTVRRVIPAGRNAHRTIVLRGDYLYDLDRETDVFASPDTTEGIWMDVISEVPFESCPPDLKERIVAEASLEFQRRFHNNSERDGTLQQELALRDVKSDRPMQRENAAAINPAPVIARPPAPPRQQ